MVRGCAFAGLSGRSLTLLVASRPQSAAVADERRRAPGCCVLVRVWAAHCAQASLNCRIRPGLPYRRRQLKSRGSPCEQLCPRLCSGPCSPPGKRGSGWTRGAAAQQSAQAQQTFRRPRCNVSELLMIDEYKGENEREDRGQIQTSVN